MKLLDIFLEVTRGKDKQLIEKLYEHWCEDCNRVFEKSIALKTHLRWHGKTTLKESPQQPGQIPEQQQPSE